MDPDEIVMYADGEGVTHRAAYKAAALTRVGNAMEFGFDKVSDDDLEELEVLTLRLLEVLKFDPGRRA